VLLHVLLLEAATASGGVKSDKIQVCPCLDGLRVVVSVHDQSTRDWGVLTNSTRNIQALEGFPEVAGRLNSGEPNFQQRSLDEGGWMI